MARFQGIDYYGVESLYTDEERMIRDVARDFVEHEFMPLIRQHHREGTFPLGLAPRMGKLGFLGAHLHGYGLPGVSNVAYGLIMQELERGDSGLRSFASVQSSLSMYAIYAYGSEEQKAAWQELLGPPFEFQPPSGGRPPFPGQPGMGPSTMDFDDL